MKISVDEARKYFTHDSQKILGTDPDNLPEDGVEYWASGPICGVFHPAPWPDVWMAHYGVLPEGWGRLKSPAIEILTAFWREKQPKRIIGWTEETNRAAVAFARRLGFEKDGEMKLGSETVIMQGWAI